MARCVRRAASMLLAVASIAAASTSVAQALRDPTRPPAAGAKGVGKMEPSAWILQSVLISPERRYAIINDEVVPVGGSISGAELLAIAEERVTLRTRDGLRVLHLFPEVTRLGISQASPGTGKRMRAPDTEKDTTGQKSGNAGSDK